jgi:hypothetical protein
VFIPFFAPVLLYEWFLILENGGTVSAFFTKDNDGMLKVPTVWFVLAPVAIGLIIFGIGSIGADPEGFGWAIYGLMFTAPLMVIVPATWIFWRENKRHKNMLDNTNTEKHGKKIWRSPLAILLLLAIIVLGGVYAYNAYLRYKVLVDSGYEKGLQSDDSFLKKCLGSEAEPTTPVSFYEITQKRLTQNNPGDNIQNKPTAVPLGQYNEQYYGYDCFENFLGDKIFRDMYPNGFKLEDQAAKSAVVDKYVNYCRDLPREPVNSMILHDQAFIPNLTYDQFCVFVLADNLSASGNQRFTLSLSQFIEAFPQWKVPKRTKNGLLEDESSFRADVSKYLCGKVYDKNTPQYTQCISPRISEYYNTVTR